MPDPAVATIPVSEPPLGWLAFESGRGLPVSSALVMARVVAVATRKVASPAVEALAPTAIVMLAGVPVAPVAAAVMLAPAVVSTSAIVL